MADNGIGYHAKSDTESSGCSADHSGYNSGGSSKEQINWWMSDEVSVQTGQQDIYNYDKMLTSEHSEEITSSDEDSAMVSKLIKSRKQPGRHARRGTSNGSSIMFK